MTKLGDFWEDIPTSRKMLMLLYIIMISVGFGLYSHYHTEAMKYEAMKTISFLHANSPNVDIARRPMTPEEFQMAYLYSLNQLVLERNPKIKDFFGSSYNSIYTLAAKVNPADDNSRKELSASLAHVASDIPNFAIVRDRLDRNDSLQLFWILGLAGVFLFVMGGYFTVKTYWTYWTY